MNICYKYNFFLKNSIIWDVRFEFNPACVDGALPAMPKSCAGFLHLQQDQHSEYSVTVKTHSDSLLGADFLKHMWLGS